jgi:phosphoribosylanthranilate isomerase
MFRIKICGIRTEADLLAVSRSGADAVGLNFHPSSVRYLAPEESAPVAKAAHGLGLKTIGVFVDQPAESIAATCERLNMFACQLHGTQSPDDANWLIRRGIRVIKAIRLPTHELNPEIICRAVRNWHEIGCPLLFDAEVGLAGGGQGARLDWEAIGEWRRTHEQVAHIQASFWGLAGGLKPETVAEAIRFSGTQAVDVASGVESSPGRKSAEKILQFATAAFTAWEVVRSELPPEPSRD